MRTASFVRARGIQLVGVLSIGLATAVAACGGGNKSFDASDGGGGEGGSGDDGGPALGDDGGGEGGSFGTTATLKSISISPSNASVVSVNDAKVTQAFKLQAELSDGSVVPVPAGATWTSDAPQVGGIGATGLYTASGALGGVVNVAASYKGKKATASLTVKLMLQQNPSNVPPGAQTGLQNATANDPSVVWAYPYDGTVWPRGLLPPILQWNGGAATDDYYVHVVSATFELQLFTTATNQPATRLPLDATTWEKMTDSSAGAAKVTVARWDGSAGTVLAKQTWTIAPASMRGIVYYWSNNLGRVLRIQPGAAMPDDFASEPPNDWSSYTQSSCLMTCHTVSADGSTIISGGGIFGGSYDLKTSTPTYYLGGTWGPSGGGPSSSSVVRWGLSAVSPTGKYVLTNSMAEGLAYANDGVTQGFLGMYTTADGMPVPASGLMGVPVAQPAWSPEGSRIVFVDAGDPVAVPWYSSWNSPPPGDLKVYQFDATKNPMAYGLQTLVATGSDPSKRIAWPTVTPDGKWVLYSRTAGADTRTAPTATDGSGPGDLYFASAITPNQEVRLSKVDGDGYPFAAGPRDVGWNFEPSFAPVAAGGYFWVVFTSRRTYGNILTGPSLGTGAVKQLWIAAIDQNPKPGADPSHAAFHLTGQDEGNLAMRGFYSLPPCKGNGQSCTSGTDCCGGYCQAGDGGTGTCGSQSSGCSQTGDKCNTTADCCAASTGVTCINHVCSEPTPQ